MLHKAQLAMLFVPIRLFRNSTPKQTQKQHHKQRNYLIGYPSVAIIGKILDGPRAQITTSHRTKVDFKLIKSFVVVGRMQVFVVVCDGVTDLYPLE